MFALVILGAWLAVGTGVAVLIGRSVTLADRQQEEPLGAVERAR